MMRSPVFLALALALGAGTGLTASDAGAQTARAVRATAEASMVLTGSIDVTADGSVSRLVLDQQQVLTPTIRTFVDSTIRGWRFEPVLKDGTPVATHAPMRVRLRSTGDADGGYQVSMTSVDFSEYDPTATDAVTKDAMAPPRYPEQAYKIGAQGEVLLLVRIDRSGAVADVIAEQVNMTVAAPERMMVKLREMLAKASIKAARGWTFKPPTSGDAVGADNWTVRIPVSYAVVSHGESMPEPYGRWQAYIPGPRQVAPWRSGNDTAQAGSDLLPAGGVYMVDGPARGLRLLTPLAQQ